MKWSIKIGEIAGIGLFLHWTFILLIGWILLAGLADGESVRGALAGIGFIIAVFGCIVLHELGHALTAQRFGIKTRDITLLPIGGVARLERIPDRPMEELLVAIAGPAVNVVIAIVLAAFLQATGRLQGLDPTKFSEADFLIRLLAVNVMLVAFNLIPAFPMDGGRVLRALLSPSMGHLRATDTAASIGQLIAIVFGVLGFFGNGMLIFIALFIYLGAQQEAQMAHVHAILEGVPVRNAMMTVFRTFTAEESLDLAIRELLAGDQRDFPVLQGNHLVGMVRGKTLIDATGDDGSSKCVSDILEKDCMVVEDNAMLQEVFEQMSQGGCSTLPVLRKGRLVGLISLENIGAWLMVQSARNSLRFHESPPRTVDV
jgi:Zn-dependent protease/CBS domain-containing protein